MNCNLYIISMIALLISACSMKADILSLIPDRKPPEINEFSLKTVPVPPILNTRRKSQVLDNIILTSDGTVFLSEISEAGYQIRSFNVDMTPRLSFGKNGHLNLSDEIIGLAAANLESSKLLFDPQAEEIIVCTVISTANLANRVRFIFISLNGKIKRRAPDILIPPNRKVSNAVFSLDKNSINLSYLSTLNPSGGSINNPVYMKFNKDGSLDVSWFDQGVFIGSHTSSTNSEIYIGNGNSFSTISQNINSTIHLGCIHYDGSIFKTNKISKGAAFAFSHNDELNIYSFSKEGGVQKWTYDCELVQQVALNLQSNEHILDIEKVDNSFHIHTLTYSGRKLDVLKVNTEDLSVQRITTPIILNAPAGLAPGSSYKVAFSQNYIAYLATGEVGQEAGKNISENTLRMTQRGGNFLPQDQLVLHFFEEFLEVNVMKDVNHSAIYGDHLLTWGTYFKTRQSLEHLIAAFDQDGKPNKTVLANGYLSFAKFRVSQVIDASDSGYFLWVTETSSLLNGILKIISPGVPDPNFGVNGFISLQSYGYISSQISKFLRDDAGLYLPLSSALVHVDVNTGAIIKSTPSSNIAYYEFDDEGNISFWLGKALSHSPPLHYAFEQYRWSSSGAAKVKEFSHTMPESQVTVAWSFMNSAATFFNVLINESYTKLLEGFFLHLDIDFPTMTISETSTRVPMTDRSIAAVPYQMIKMENHRLNWLMTTSLDDRVATHLISFDTQSKSSTEVILENTRIANISRSENKKIYFMGLRGFYTNPEQFLHILEFKKNSSDTNH